VVGGADSQPGFGFLVQLSNSQCRHAVNAIIASKECKAVFGSGFCWRCPTLAGTLFRLGGAARPSSFLFRFQVDGFYWKVPVGCEDFETLLFLAFVGFFVGE